MCLRCSYTTNRWYLLSAALQWYEDAHLKPGCPLETYHPPAAQFPYPLRTELATECESCQQVRMVNLAVYQDATFIVCERCFPCKTREKVG
jgi:hypothetical protein